MSPQSGDAASSPSPRRRWPFRHRLPLIPTFVGWFVVLLLAGFAVARLVAWDGTELFVLVDAVTVWVYLPAWLVALVALLGRRWLLGAAALIVVAAQLTYLAPEVLASSPLPSWTAHAPTLHLFDANVYDANPSMAGYARVIARDRPDLVTLEEANPNDFRQLERAGAFRGLPHTYEVNRWDPFAFVVASRYPLHDTRVVERFGRPLAVETHVELPSGAFALWVVHTVAPYGSDWRQWTVQLADLAALAHASRARRLLVVGDFNATWNNRGFRTLLATGLTDAAAARGEPFLMTWSQFYAPIPPFVRIDHVLTRGGLAVTAVGAGRGPGSDHRCVTATIAVRTTRLDGTSAPSSRQGRRG